MKITLITLCSALAAVSVAENVPQHRRHDNRPRYYFPRVIKRQVDSPFGNSTSSTTTQGALDGLISTVDDTLASVAADLEGDTSTTTDTTATSTPGDTATVPTPTPTTTDPGLVGGIVDDLTGPTPTTTQFTVGVDTVISGTPTDTSTIDTSLLGSISSAASEVLEDASSAASSVLEVASSLQSEISTAVGDQLASISSALSSAQDVASSIASDVSSANSVLSPTIPLVTDSLSASLTITPPPIDTGSVTVSPPPIDTGSGTISPPPIDTGSGTVSPPPIDTGSGTISPPPIDTGSGTVSPPPIDTGSATVSPTIDTGSASETVTPPADKPTDTPINPIVPIANETTPEPSPTLFASSSNLISVKPTGTDTNTALTPASSIESAEVRPSSSAPSSSASAIPTTLPRVITPEGGVPEKPDNSTLIQIGFLYGLNYEFVVNSSTAVAQIFTYLPLGITGGLNIDKKEMVMQYLQPYNTLPTAGYITTLAMAYVPTEELDQLSVDLLNPKAALYTNGTDSVKTLMAMVDPTVPLLAGSQLAGGTPINSADGSSQTNSEGGEGGTGFDESSSGGPVNPSSVGIALGAVGGAVVYGAAMFLVARRYKKRKAAHQRASSVNSGPRAHENSNLMTGARNSYGSRYPNRGGSRNSDRSDESGNSGRSGRTYISPPVMAENSLGWN